MSLGIMKNMNYYLITSFILLNNGLSFKTNTIDNVNNIHLQSSIENTMINNNNSNLVHTDLHNDKTITCLSDNPIVHTSVGIYCGLREIVHWPNGPASMVDVYYGIRYAQSPTGSLRFKKPVEPIPEPKKIFMADKLPSTCPQPKDTMFQNSAAARMWVPNTPMSEDCLFLNIWVPLKESNSSHSNSKEKLAVMLWIYGGSFYMGTATLSVYDARFLAARQNVIVASMNYRLGSFGFLYMNTEEAPGNMGLWDQRLAMKWIKNHIENFGGDSHRITLFGESAGAVSVSTHVVSPWLAKILGCGYRSSMDQIKCLRSKSITEILDAHDTMYDPASYFSVPFPPVLDNNFFPYENSQSFRQLKYLKPSGALMFGINKNEGSYFLLYAFVSNSKWMKNLTDLPITNRMDYLRCLRQPTLESWTERLEEISSDRSFKCPTINMATAVTNDYRIPGRRRAHTLPVYFYEFQHRTLSLPMPKWTGTMHGYEIEYVFGIPFSPQFQASFYRFTDEERQLSDIMMTYWANFARTGDPNILPDGRHVTDNVNPEGPDEITGGELEDSLNHKQGRKNPFIGWPEFRNSTKAYIVFRSAPANLLVSTRPRHRQCLFWRRWYPALLQQGDLVIKVFYLSL
uniref:Carboxylic ester hydrolase n=1 Tax=Schistosoma haematobium TaxID=6185 RepID=A0A095ARK7_SCHHA